MTESDASKLLNSADTADWKRRAEIVNSLIQIGKPAIPTLVSDLQNSSWYVRNCIATALQKMGWEPSTDVEKILFLIARWNIKANYDEIVDTGPRAVKYLIPLLKAKPEWAVEKAIEALGKIGDRRATQPLIELLSQPGSFLMEHAIHALADIGDSRAVKALIGILQSWDSEKEPSKYPLSDIVRALSKLGIGTKEVILIGIHRERLEEDVASGQIECPHCGETIDLPLMAKKLGSTGAYFYYLFNFPCAKCGKQIYYLGMRLFVVLKK